MLDTIFKPYLLGARSYKGGKTADEVTTKASKIYKLSSNENPLGTSPKAIKAIQDNLQNLHIYPDRTGNRLQEALSDFYNQELSDEHFVPTNSGSEIIEFIARCFLKEGNECIVSNPSFMPYTMFSTWNGASIIDIPLKQPDYSLDVEGILNAVNKNTRLVFVTSPNNPTGTYIPKVTLEKLIHNLPQHVVLVMDEVYYHFADASDYTTALPYIKAGKNIIAVNSFSKTFGLAALRMGYAYSTPQIANYLRRLYRPFLINKLGLFGAIAALEDKDFVNQTVELVQQERKRLYPLLDELSIVYWKTQANFILFKSPIDASKLVDQLLMEVGVMVRPVPNFGAKNGQKLGKANKYSDLHP